jgi:hypothetical protein
MLVCFYSAEMELLESSVDQVSTQVEVEAHGQ